MSFYNNLKKTEAFLLLNGIPGIGPISARNLLNSFDWDPTEVLRANKNSLLEVSGIGEKIITSIKNPANQDWLLSEMKKIKKMGASFCDQNHLPDLLMEIYDPPIGLYIAGEIPDLPCVAIVGTRNPSMYGQKQARLMAGDLARAGYCIVSGMARGIDSAAHEGALDAGGKTIAFLGSGLDIIYPPENVGLYKRIIKNGGVISEFPFGRKADRRTFPMRNRLVSGISQAVLVVESAASGGSLITAQFAADQGRTVFAVPGRLDQASSAGCHKILREGATLARSAKDIIEDLRPYMKENQKLLNFQDEVNDLDERKSNLGDLSAIEKILIKELSEGEQLSLDELCHRGSLSISDTMSALSLLELSRLVKKHANGKFEIV